MFGITDSKNYENIAEALRSLKKVSTTFKPEEMSVAMDEITEKDFEKYKVPIIVFSDIKTPVAGSTWAANDPIYSEYLTGDTYDSKKTATTPYNSKADNKLYTFSTHTEATNTAHYENSWIWDQANATLDNPEVFKQNTATNLKDKALVYDIKKHHLFGKIEIFANGILDGGHLVQNFKFDDSEKTVLPDVKGNYKQEKVDLTTTSFDSDNSLWVIENNGVQLILTTAEKTELGLTGGTEYYRKNNTDIYCYDSTTGDGKFLTQSYNDDNHQYNYQLLETTTGEWKEYKQFYNETYVFYYKKKNKYKVALKEGTVYYECDDTGRYDDGYLRVQGDYSIIHKKHGWKFKLKNKIKLVNDWPKSKTYTLKGYYEDGSATFPLTDMLFDVWRELTDERNGHQNAITMQYWNGTAMVSSSFTDYNDMSVKYHATIDYLKDNGTETELDEYKAAKPSIINYIDSVGKGAPIQVPCLVFWEKTPVEGQTEKKYACHGLYALQMPLNDKTLGYDEDDDPAFCIMDGETAPRNNSDLNNTIKGTNTVALTTYENAGSFSQPYRIVDPIKNIKSPILNGAVFDSGESYLLDEKIAAFNKLIEVTFDNTKQGAAWLTELKKYLDVDSLADYAILKTWTADPDKFYKNQFWWIDDATKIGDGVHVWRFACDGWRFFAQETYGGSACGNGLKLDRPAVGTTLTSTEKGRLPLHHFKNQWTCLNFLLFRLWNTTDAIVSRFNQIKHLLSHDHVTEIFTKKLRKYFLCKVEKTTENSHVIKNSTEGSEFYHTYVRNPLYWYMYGQINTLLDTNPSAKELSEKYWINEMFNSETAVYMSNSDLPTLDDYLLQVYTFGNQNCKTSVLGAVSFLKSDYQLKGFFDLWYRRAEEMCSAKETADDGTSRPAVYSFIKRMKFFDHANTTLDNFNYDSDYIDVFSLLDYKEPKWVDRSTLGGGENKVNGKYTPDVNNAKKYANYTFASDGLTITGYENIVIENLKVDGVAVTAAAMGIIKSFQNGYITFVEGTTGTHTITCNLANNDKLKGPNTKADDAGLNKTVKSNTITITVNGAVTSLPDNTLLVEIADSDAARNWVETNYNSGTKSYEKVSDTQYKITNTSNNWESMFEIAGGEEDNTYLIKVLDIGDVSNVTNMNYMFNSCVNLTSFNPESWTTTNVESVKYMFAYCYKIESGMLAFYNKLINNSNIGVPSIANCGQCFTKAGRDGGTTAASERAQIPETPWGGDMSMD